MTGSVVVGVDGSTSSIDALLWARRLATALNAQILAVTSWQYPASYGASSLIGTVDYAGDAVQAQHDALKIAYGDDMPEGMDTVVLQGHPAEVLLESSAGAEMLVVGSRGHGGFVGLLMGATSAYCAEHADCPVLVTHSAATAH